MAKVSPSSATGSWGGELPSSAPASRQDGPAATGPSVPPRPVWSRRAAHVPLGPPQRLPTRKPHGLHTEIKSKRPAAIAAGLSFEKVPAGPRAGHAVLVR